MSEHVTSFKYIGVPIKSDFNWDEHKINIVTKANMTLGFLIGNLKIKSTNVKEKANKLIFGPLVEYASTIRDPHTKSQVGQMETIQRRVTHFVTGRHH